MTVEHDPMCPKWPEQFDSVTRHPSACQCETIAAIRDDERERAVQRLRHAAELASDLHDRPANLIEYARAVRDQL